MSLNDFKNLNKPRKRKRNRNIGRIMRGNRRNTPLKESRKQKKGTSTGK
jgi:hypothetical protein